MDVRIPPFPPSRGGTNEPLRLIHIMLFLFRLDTHFHPFFRNTHMSLFHPLRRFIRDLVRDTVACIPDEARDADPDDKHEKGDQI